MSEVATRDNLLVAGGLDGGHRTSLAIAPNQALWLAVALSTRADVPAITGGQQSSMDMPSSAGAEGDRSYH